MRSVRLVSSLLCCALLTLAGTGFAEDPAHGNLPHGNQTSDLFEYVEGADSLEGQILAPCCWNQTLDIHGSETANELRREIRSRLRKGEAVDTIKSDIVGRYGAKVLAVPPGSPLKGVAVGLSVAFGAAGIAAAWMLTRWRRRAERARAETRAIASQAEQAAPDEYDHRLDAELDNLRG